MSDMTNRLAERVKLKDAHIITRMADIAEGLTDVIRLGRGDPDLDTPAQHLTVRLSGRSWQSATRSGRWPRHRRAQG